MEPRTKNTILIVEDCASNMMLFCDILERVGYATVCADTGLKAIRLARTHRPDLILLDIKLPDVDGTKVIRWLRQDEGLRDVPVVAVTAFAMLGDRERIMDAGFDAYMSKPISVRSFIEVVGNFIAAKTIPFGPRIAQDARC